MTTDDVVDEDNCVERVGIAESRGYVKTVTE